LLATLPVWRALEIVRIRLLRLSVYEADSADDDKPLLFVDSIDDPVGGKFVLPVKISGDRREVHNLGIDREFFRQNFLELVFYAPSRAFTSPKASPVNRMEYLGSIPLKVRQNLCHRV